jgi:hypothetical protein
LSDIINDEGFEVLTALVIKSSIFWGLTPCSPLEVNRYFGGTFSLHLQRRKTGPKKKSSMKAGGKIVSYLAHSSTLKTLSTMPSHRTKDQVNKTYTIKQNIDS